MIPSGVLRQWTADARATRIAHRLTQAELASHAGVSLGLIKRFEAGGGITLHAFVRIAIALGRGGALSELLRPPAPIAGLGVTEAELATMSIADLEAAQSSKTVKPKIRVRHARRDRSKR